MLSKKNIVKYNSPLDETNYYDPFALLEKAKGSFLWMKGDEVPFVDLIMGYSSTNFGHSNDTIMKIVMGEIKRYDNIPSFNSTDKIELSKKLVDLLPYSSNRLVYFPVGGTKAVDAAIKLARAYTKKTVVVSFKGGFHGYSFGGMSVTDSNFIEKKQFAVNDNVKTFDFPNRTKANSRKDVEIILCEIENYFSLYNSEIAAIIFEPIQGAAGFIIPPDDFLSRLIKIANKYGIVTICDEIQTGVYRTGSFYYINQLKIDPDIVLLGKSLAGGFYPLSAVIARKHFFESVDYFRPAFDSTFANNLLALRIANNVLDYTVQNNIIETIQTTGNIFLKELIKFEKSNFIKEIDGKGMLFSFRVESPKKTMEANVMLAKRIRKEAYSNHLIIQTAGVKNDYIKLSPSFLISTGEISEVFKRLEIVMRNINKQI